MAIYLLGYLPNKVLNLFLINNLVILSNSCGLYIWLIIGVVSMC